MSYMFSFLHKLLIDIKQMQYTSVSIYDINNTKAAGFHFFSPVFLKYVNVLNYVINYHFNCQGTHPPCYK